MSRCIWFDQRGQCRRGAMVDQGYCPTHIGRAKDEGLVEPTLGELARNDRLTTGALPTPQEDNE